MRGTLSIVLGAAAIPLLLGGTTAVEHAGVDAGQVTVHTVEISLNAETGAFSYSQDPVTAAPGDQIEWVCEEGAWSVHFIDRTPLPQQALRAARGSARRLPVRSDAAAGSYKYFVAVAIGDDVFTDDPEVIVRPGPGH